MTKSVLVFRPLDLVHRVINLRLTPAPGCVLCKRSSNGWATHEPNLADTNEDAHQHRPLLERRTGSNNGKAAILNAGGSDACYCAADDEHCRRRSDGTKERAKLKYDEAG